jgi:hypothetical protein
MRWLVGFPNLRNRHEAWDPSNTQIAKSEIEVGNLCTKEHRQQNPVRNPASLEGRSQGLISP